MASISCAHFCTFYHIKLNIIFQNKKIELIFGIKASLQLWTRNYNQIYKLISVLHDSPHISKDMFQLKQISRSVTPPHLQSSYTNLSYISRRFSALKSLSVSVSLMWSETMPNHNVIKNSMIYLNRTTRMSSGVVQVWKLGLNTEDCVLNCPFLNMKTVVNSNQ